VRLAYSFAMGNDLIRADAIEASEFPELSTQYLVYAVPRTVINGGTFIEGSLPEDFFLDAVLKAAAPAGEGTK
jgi:predicted DsbA family dithiol-disulfide isomerase